MNQRRQLLRWLAATVGSTVAFVLCGYATADQDVSIQIVAASAYRWHPPSHLVGGYTVLDCKLVIVNTAPEKLMVRSGYESPFDGIALAITRDDNRPLAEAQSTLHNAPIYGYPGKQFDIPTGRTTNEIRFTVTNMFPEDNHLRIYVHGKLIEALAKSKFSYSITSSIVHVILSDTTNSRVVRSAFKTGFAGSFFQFQLGQLEG